MTATSKKAAPAGRRPRKTAPAAPELEGVSKLDRLSALLLREGGATIADMVAATGWQQHSVRGALAGSLRKRGLSVASVKTDGIRRYSATAS